MEYYQQGLFERTGNIWRAQGGRARFEFQHFRRHAMTQAILNQDEIEGWRGEVRDGEAVARLDGGQASSRRFRARSCGAAH
jgi:hypothetical protein